MRTFQTPDEPKGDPMQDAEQYAREIAEVAYLAEVVKRAGRYIYDGNDTGVLVCLLLIQKSLEARIATVARGLHGKYPETLRSDWFKSGARTGYGRSTEWDMSPEEVTDLVTRDLKQLWDSPDTDGYSPSPEEITDMVERDLNRMARNEPLMDSPEAGSHLRLVEDDEIDDE